MKLAAVFTADGKEVRYKEGEPVVLPVFRWFVLTSSEQQWRLDLLAMLYATTENFKFQQFQGLVAFGWVRKFRPFVEFNLFRPMRLGG